jgi:sulfatase maturation enzyme AslB (radical SAM superfamily)
VSTTKSSVSARIRASSRSPERPRRLTSSRIPTIRIDPPRVGRSRPGFSTLTIVLTDRCNFACAYCYQKKGRRTLSRPTLLRTLDGLHPYFHDHVVVNFYGGEPLLAFDLIRAAVEHLGRLDRGARRRIRFSVSTNGSLIDDEVLAFLDEHAISVLLSFDGTAQNTGRKKGSFGRLVALIQKILSRPRIDLATNSIFTARTIGQLVPSLELLLRLGVRRIHAGVTSRGGWTAAASARLEREMASARSLLLERYDRLADVPWVEMVEADPPGNHRCDAGREQIALGPDGRLWGCFLFPHYFDGRRGAARGDAYCFGNIDAFAADPEGAEARVLAAAARLGMLSARTPERACVLCDEFWSCWICPLAAAFGSGQLGEITAPGCELAKRMRKEKDRLKKDFSARRSYP